MQPVVGLVTVYMKVPFVLIVSLLSPKELKSNLENIPTKVGIVKRFSNLLCFQNVNGLQGNLTTLGDCHCFQTFKLNMGGEMS